MMNCTCDSEPHKLSCPAVDDRPELPLTLSNCRCSPMETCAPCADAAELEYLRLRVPAIEAKYTRLLDAYEWLEAKDERQEARIEHALTNLSIEVTRRTAIQDRFEQLQMATAFHAGQVAAALKRIEYSADFCDDPACPECLMAPWKGTTGHAPSCPIAALIKASDAFLY